MTIKCFKIEKLIRDKIPALLESKEIVAHAKSIKEAEEFFIQGEVKPYLQKLSSPNCEEHPFFRSQLLDLIDTFLNMVETRMNQHSFKLQQAKNLKSLQNEHQRLLIVKKVIS